MRVLVLTNLYPNPLQPDRAPYSRQQFRALAAEHEVRVIAPVAWTDEWSRRRSGAPAMPAGRQRTCDGMVVHHPRYVFTPKVLRSRYGPFLARSVRGCFERAVDELRPDVVLGCWAYPDGWAAVRLARAAGLPVAIKVVGSDVLCVDDHAGRRRRSVDALGGADHVIAVSRDLAARAVTLGVDPGRLSVVYNGVDTDLFRPGPKDEARQRVGYTSGDPLLVFAGNLVPVKGLDVLLDALATLAGRGRPFRCVLIGDGPLRDALGRRAARLGLAGRVRFTGSRPLEELPSWYRAADLFVLPSRSEGVPNVLLEAASCGTPFVASRVGGIPEIAPSDALVEAGNAAALADRIERSLAGGGPNGASPFGGRTWSESARDLAAVLGGIVGSR
jgi:glycosyltransferase involved in cell wall biosynthesis